MTTNKEKLIFLVGYAESANEEKSLLMTENYKLLKEQLNDEPLDLEQNTANRLLLKRLVAADKSNLVWVSIYMNWV